jgi:hypothetical protein
MIEAGFQQTWLGKPSTPAMFPFDAESLALGIWPRVQDKHDEYESPLSLLQRCLEISQTAVYHRIAPRRFDRQYQGKPLGMAAAGFDTHCRTLHPARAALLGPTLPCR